MTVYYFWGRRLASGHAENPNEAINNRLNGTGLFLKMFGTYQGPWALAISPMVRRQAGLPLARLVSTELRAGVTPIRVERVGTYRGDSPTVVDMRIEKQFRRGPTKDFTVFADVYNFLNSNAAQVQDNVTGRRTTILEGERGISTLPVASRDSRAGRLTIRIHAVVLAGRRARGLGMPQVA